MTPYYSDDLVSLYHGDADGWVAEIATADVAVTDPPYGFGTYDADREASLEVLRACLQTRAAAIFGFPELLARWCIRLGRAPDEWVTWWPTNSKRSSRAYGGFLSRESEHVAIFGPTHGERILRRRSDNKWARKVTENRGLDPDWCRDGDVWRDPLPGAGTNGGRLHINEKPVSVMQRLVLLTSNEGETVCDPYAGSGTTLVAAKMMGRRALGIEIDEKHCETAARRLAQGVLFGETA